MADNRDNDSLVKDLIQTVQDLSQRLIPRNDTLKRKRCRGIVTLTASVYHPLLRKQIPMATMEATTEDTTNITLFWKLFNEVLQKVKGDKNYKFKPSGWCTDMAGANLAALSDVFGSEAAQFIKTCEIHFKDHRNKKARKIDESSTCRFKELCDALLLSETVDGYETAKKSMDAFLDECESRHFPDKPGCPGDSFGWTGKSGNRVPSHADLQRRKHVREIKKAKQAGKEIFDQVGDGLLIDPASSYHPKDTYSKSRKTQPSQSSQKRRPQQPTPSTVISQPPLQQSFAQPPPPSQPAAHPPVI
ncbi:hypothetical protein AC249_AIPGENE7225 [Exaiptasia diaphana]|nr:hypothetical protein AC249_AIPGENE7225 [Exaiptasia diaphana]